MIISVRISAKTLASLAKFLDSKGLSFKGSGGIASVALKIMEQNLPPQHKFRTEGEGIVYLQENFDIATKQESDFPNAPLLRLDDVNLED